MGKKYSLVLADPPYGYNARNNANTRYGGGAMAHYPTMPADAICALPVRDITAGDCALILWATFPKLPEALRVMDAWGFRYATVAFNWFKTAKNGAPCFGVGYYTKSNTEIALLGIRGKMKPASNFISQVVVSERERHSRKPGIVRDKIVELFGDLPRIELFAREEAPGWDAWGNEVPGDADIFNSHGRKHGESAPAARREDSAETRRRITAEGGCEIGISAMKCQIL
jgi:site-specific DNA-methyltransferase (adenine-specific)